MSGYEFVSVWHIDAPVAEVWRLINDADTWPDWWPGVLSSVELKAGDADGVGSIRRSVWKSRLPYKLEFDSEVVRITPESLIEVRAFGQLEGRGLWQLTPVSETSTRVQYDWTVKTTTVWMNALAPIARPFFRWNHDVIMRWGETGLNKRMRRARA
jgi:uncharacterized protein YndB with AHSA1/START domain